MLDEAIAALHDMPGIAVRKYSLAGKRIAGCVACHRCRDLGTCYTRDDFDEFLHLWLGADGLIYAAPVFHFGPPGLAKNAFDKLGHVMFAKFNRRLPRFCKVGGILVQGSSRYGGQEAAIGFFVSSLLLMNCMPVSGDTPGSYVGGAGFAPTWQKGSIRKDQPSLDVARNVARRVAEMTLVVRNGLNSLSSVLPKEYGHALGRAQYL
jgi:multimeric flavodoxin WrbA